VTEEEAAREAGREWLKEHSVAVTGFVDMIAIDALSKLHCLGLAGDASVRGKLRALVDKVVISKFEAGPYCTGLWETDETFVVTVESTEIPGELRIRATLVLGESKIQC
jgi:hypothetical protein